MQLQADPLVSRAVPVQVPIQQQRVVGRQPSQPLLAVLEQPAQVRSGTRLGAADPGQQQDVLRGVTTARVTPT